MTQKAEEFTEELAKQAGTKMLIVLQDAPDPDALGSALAHSLLAAREGIETTLLHAGEVSHQENRALTKLLGIESSTYGEGFDFSAYDTYCLVDSQGATVSFFQKIPESLCLFSVVDHHAGPNDLHAEFVDIRPDVGATASIYVEYLMDSDRHLERDKDEFQRAATALLVGIRADTGKMLTATAFDYQQASRICGHADAAMVRRVESQTRSRQTLDLIRKALDNMEVHGTFALAGVGNLRGAHKDAIPQAADFFLTVEGIESAIVYGNVDGTVQGSLRTKSDQIDPDSFLKEIFGKDEDGNYYGGGRNHMGGFQIPLGYLSHHTVAGELWRLVKERVEGDILRVLGPESMNR